MSKLFIASFNHIYIYVYIYGLAKEIEHDSNQASGSSCQFSVYPEVR